MKKIFCVFLCAVLVFCSTAVSINAEQESPAYEWDGHPIVFIQGYSGPILVRDRGLETEEEVWGINPKDLVKKLITNLYDIVTSLADYADGNTEPFVECFRNVSAELIDDISMMPDGTSKYNISSYPYYVWEASVEYINEEKDGKYLPMTEGEFIEDICKTVPESQIFIFNADWRRSQIDNCEHLVQFIDEVLKHTGSDKIDLYGMSHGGQLAATYLYYHGTEGKVDNAVLNSPAIGGTSLVMELLGAEPVEFDICELLRFGCVMLHLELDLRWLGKLMPAEFLNSVLKTAFNEVLLPHAVYFGSVWDLMDGDTYIQLRDKLLDPVENAAIIEKADKLHLECIPDMSNGLKRAQESGVNVSIISNYGTILGTGEPVDSDFIINTKNTSGAFTAPYGEHFADDYVQLNTTCNDPSHNHISPSRTVDASAGFLPENTWFNYGQYHNQSWWDVYTRGLQLELLLTDNITDIYADPRYPQFEQAQSPLDGVHATFSNEKTGFYNASSNTLVLRNLSGGGLNITSIKANGEEILSDKLVIKEGNSIEVPFTPSADESFIKLDIEYSRRGKILSDPFVRTVYFSPAK